MAMVNLADLEREHGSVSRALELFEQVPGSSQPSPSPDRNMLPAIPARLRCAATWTASARPHSCLTPALCELKAASLPPFRTAIKEDSKEKKTEDESQESLAWFETWVSEPRQVRGDLVVVIPCAIRA